VRELRHCEYKDEVEEELNEANAVAFLGLWITQQAGGTHSGELSGKSRREASERRCPGLAAFTP
jgi:hypothetical protein